MTDFYSVLTEIEQGQACNPYSGRDTEGNWIEGSISIDFLNTNFGQYVTSTDMKAATTSEGLQLFFDYLVEQGKLPA